jgi:polysaccharide biosynthesis/export protein
MAEGRKTVMTWSRLSVLSLVAVVVMGAFPWADAQGQNRPGMTSPPASTPGGARPAPSSAPTTTAPAASPTTMAPPSSTTTSVGNRPLSAEYVIGPGDMLQISVWKNESLSRMAPVRPDGKISLPLLHDVMAAGLTAMQLRDKIALALAEFLPNPEVAVSVAEVRSLRISVLGEVARPGVIELRGQTSILEAIALAGGFQPFASPSKITVIRTDDKGQTKRIRFNYNKAVSASGNEDNFLMHPGDVVIVP